VTELRHDQLDSAWSGVADGYEESFAIYTGPYADDALRLAEVEPGHRLLDVAAGSGALSLRAARLGADVLATDFAAGMVELLRQRFADEDLPARAEVMDGQALTVESESFDRAASMFGVIFFPDIERGLAELARVVRPGGRVCVATWRLDSFRLSDHVRTAMTRAIPGFEAPTEPPAWAHIGDADGLAAALEGAGLAPVVVHTVGKPWHFDDPVAFFKRLPDWSPPVQPLFETLDDATIERAALAFAEVIAEVADAAGGALVCDALIGIGTKP
jgi:SAM-dependent methyltransferase